MYNYDDYMQNMSIKNKTYLNYATTEKDQNDFKSKRVVNILNDDVTLTQQIYLILLSILALKVLSISMYSK